MARRQGDGIDNYLHLLVVLALSLGARVAQLVEYEVTV